MSKSIVAAVVVAAALIGGVVLVASNRRPALNPGVDEGRLVAEEFLSLLRQDAPAAVWDATTPEFKSAEGRSKFVARVKRSPWVRESMTFNSAQPVHVNQSERLEFVFTSGKTGKPVRLLLAKDQGQWRVDRLSF
jgi:hypothetical protein